MPVYGDAAQRSDAAVVEFQHCRADVDFQAVDHVHGILDAGSVDVGPAGGVEIANHETVVVALNQRKIDLVKLRPLLFDMSSAKYWSVGNIVANCWSAGKKMKKS